jgi:hypothetical protein
MPGRGAGEHIVKVERAAARARAWLQGAAPRLRCVSPGKTSLVAVCIQSLAPARVDDKLRELLWSDGSDGSEDETTTAIRRGLEYSGTPSVEDKTEWGFDAASILHADVGTLSSIAEEIECSSRYGLTRFRSPAGTAEAMSICAADVLQHAYDFETGGLLLRAAAILGDSGSYALRACREFLCEQQDMDGSFGILGRELDLLARHVPEYDADELKLTFTLAALRTLVITGREAGSHGRISLDSEKCGLTYFRKRI